MDEKKKLNHTFLKGIRKIYSISFLDFNSGHRFISYDDNRLAKRALQSKNL